MNAARRLAVAPILLYQRVLSPLLPRRCKYEPSCSAYAVQAIRELGVPRGVVVSAWRGRRALGVARAAMQPVVAWRLRSGLGAAPLSPARCSAAPLDARLRERPPAPHRFLRGDPEFLPRQRRAELGSLDHRADARRAGRARPA